LLIDVSADRVSKEAESVTEKVPLVEKDLECASRLSEKVCERFIVGPVEEKEPESSCVRVFDKDLL
jgi:hypothetical protein